MRNPKVARTPRGCWRATQPRQFYPGDESPTKLPQKVKTIGKTNLHLKIIGQTIFVIQNVESKALDCFSQAFQWQSQGSVYFHCLYNCGQSFLQNAKSLTETHFWQFLAKKKNWEKFVRSRNLHQNPRL